jgi:DNA-binding NarL/FixJ family response regulator
VPVAGSPDWPAAGYAGMLSAGTLPVMEASTIDPSDPAPVRPVRVGIVDDHPSIGAAIAAAVVETDGLVVIGQARTLDDGLVLAARVDVLVCDVQLDGRAEGLELLEAIHRRPDPPAVLMLSGFGQTSVVRAAIERGAAGYLDKGAEVPDILAAIRTVAAGGTVYSAARLRAVSAAPRPPSARERQVIDRVIAGLTNAEVGADLGVTEKTVESHLRRLFDRYGLVSRTELAVLAMREGWTAGPPAPG